MFFLCTKINKLTFLIKSTIFLNINIKICHNFAGLLWHFYLLTFWKLLCERKAELLSHPGRAAEKGVMTHSLGAATFLVREEKPPRWQSQKEGVPHPCQWPSATSSSGAVKKCREVMCLVNVGWLNERMKHPIDPWTGRNSSRWGKGPLNLERLSQQPGV